MPDFTAMVPRYQHLRQISKKLTTDLVRTLSQDMILTGGRALGVLKGNTLVINSDELGDILMDYCLYNVHQGGLNAVQLYLAAHRPPIGSDELFLLTAKTQARYSVFLVQEVVKQTGLRLLDLHTNEALFLIDIGMSNTAQKGLCLAGRMIPLGDYWICSGSAIGLTRTDLQSIRSLLPSLLGDKLPHQLPPEKYDAFVAALIRCCLENKDRSSTFYADPHEWQIAQKMGLPWQTLAPSRNEPCPCGSGRKYKNCCDK